MPSAQFLFAHDSICLTIGGAELGLGTGGGVGDGIGTGGGRSTAGGEFGMEFGGGDDDSENKYGIVGESSTTAPFQDGSASVIPMIDGRAIRNNSLFSVQNFDSGFGSQFGCRGLVSIQEGCEGVCSCP